MGERLIVECDDCRQRMRCSSRPLRSWETACFWAKGAEILPCADYREDVRIETGFVPPRPHVGASARNGMIR